MKAWEQKTAECQSILKTLTRLTTIVLETLLVLAKKKRLDSTSDLDRAVNELVQCAATIEQTQPEIATVRRLLAQAQQLATSGYTQLFLDPGSGFNPGSGYKTFIPEDKRQGGVKVNCAKCKLSVGKDEAQKNDCPHYICHKCVKE